MKLEINNSKYYLGKIVNVEIDRQLGSTHPKFPDHIYPINYGYINGTIATDGGGIDAFILGEEKPLKKFTGKCIALIHRTDDDDDKLVVCAIDKDFSDDQIREQTYFQEKYFESVIIRQ